MTELTLVSDETDDHGEDEGDDEDDDIYARECIKKYCPLGSISQYTP